MGISVSIEGASEVASGMWQTRLSPNEVRGLGPAKAAFGAISVIMVHRPQYERASETLRFSPQDTTILNVGSSARAVLLDADAAWQTDTASMRAKILGRDPKPGSGDHDFLQMLNRQGELVRDAGRAILSRVREHFPGELKRVSQYRFQETPDNFWFITIQPKARSLLVTVRGLPSRFSTHRLKVLEDRRPYSRFKVVDPSQVDEAVAIIRNAIRK